MLGVMPVRLCIIFDFSCVDCIICVKAFIDNFRKSLDDSRVLFFYVLCK